MAKKVQFIEATSTQLESLSCVDGRFIYVTDKGLLYRDTSSQHVQVSGPPVLIQTIEHTNDTNSTMILIATGSYLSVTASGEALSFNYI